MKMNRYRILKSIGALILAIVLTAAFGVYVPDWTLAAGGTVTVTLSEADGLDPNTTFDFKMYKVGHFSGPGLVLEDELEGAAAEVDLDFPSDSEESESEKANRMLASVSHLAKYIDDNAISLTAIGGVHQLKPGESFTQAVDSNGLYLVRGNTVRDSADGSKFNWTPQPVYVAVLNGDSSITIANIEDVVIKIVRTPVSFNHRVQKAWTIPSDVMVNKPDAIFVNIRYAGKIVDTVKLTGGENAWAYIWQSEEDGDTYKYIGTDDSGNKKEVSFTPAPDGAPKWTCDEILDAEAYAESFEDLAYEGVTARTFSDEEKAAIENLAKRFRPEYIEPGTIEPATYPVDQAAQIAEYEINNIYDKTELLFTKKLDGYVDAGEASNVTMGFKVVATNSKGATVYENTVGITFNKKDEVDEDGFYTKTAVVKDIPANATKILITEVYSAGYTGSAPVEAKKGADGKWYAEMDNTHGPGQGSGVVNKYANGEYVDPAASDPN